MRGRLGYWIKDEAVLKLEESKSHVEAIIKKPSLFGMDHEEVHEAYQRHGEKLGLEGKAREELMKKALLRGWIRVRFHMRENRWSIQCSDLEKQMSTIKYFISYLFDKENDPKIIHEEDLVIVSDMEGGYEKAQAKRFRMPD